MLGLRRGTAAMAVAGLLATASACDPLPAPSVPEPSDDIEVTYLTLPGDPEMSARSVMVNDHGKVVVSGGGPGISLAYLWSGGEWATFGEQLWPRPSDVSNNGHVVGIFEGANAITAPNAPFLWAHGEWTRLPTGDDTPSGGAYAVNDHGTVAGQVGGYAWGIARRRAPGHISSYNGRAAVWHEGELLTPPLADGELDSSAARHVNNANQVLIASGIGGSLTDTPRWALWEIGAEEVTYLDNPYASVGVGTVMVTLNDQGMVFGDAVVLGGLPGFPNPIVLRSAAYLWHEGRRTDLGSLGGGWTSVRAANAWGQAVGLSRDADGNEHPFLWYQGTMTRLDMPDDAEVSDFEPVDINNWGQVVGMGTGADGVRRPFLWQNGRTANLGEVAGVGQVPGNWQPDINDRGQIVYHTDNTTGAGPNVILWEVSPLWGYPGAMD